MKTPRQSSPCHQSNPTAAARAHAEILLLGLAVMNAWQLAPRRFSLVCLRDGLRMDDGPPPPFKRCWCLRSMADQHAAGIFLEAELAFEAVAKEFGLEIHLCPSDSRWAVLARLGMVVHWPQAEGDRRKWQR